MLAKLFARKHEAKSAATGEETTMVLMLVKGDVKSLMDESMHLVEVTDSGGFLTLKIEKAQRTDEFLGHAADQILTAM